MGKYNIVGGGARVGEVSNQPRPRPTRLPVKAVPSHGSSCSRQHDYKIPYAQLSTFLAGSKDMEPR